MNRFYMICFDVSHPRRLRLVAGELENFGQRVQRSVFECWLDEDELFELKRRLTRHLDPQEDRLRYYSLCQADVKRIEIDGPGHLTTDIDYILS